MWDYRANVYKNAAVITFFLYRITTSTQKLHKIPFSNGAFLYFSKRFTAIDSNRTLAAGYSLRTSHISVLLSTNKSLYPTERTLAVRRLPNWKENYNGKKYISKDKLFILKLY